MSIRFDSNHRRPTRLQATAIGLLCGLLTVGTAVAAQPAKVKVPIKCPALAAAATAQAAQSRIHMAVEVTDGTPTHGPRELMHGVVIGERVYSVLGTGVFDSEMRGDSRTNSVGGVHLNEFAKDRCEIVGDTTLAGRTMTLYAQREGDGDDLQEVKVWVDKTTHLPAKMMMNLPDYVVFELSMKMLESAAGRSVARDSNRPAAGTSEPAERVVSTAVFLYGGAVRKPTAAMPDAGNARLLDAVFDAK
jgi:hypothetical protein